MTKAEIVSEISDRTGLEKDAVMKAVESFMEVVKESLAKGENIYLRGFGTFLVKRRAEKTARDINHNTTITVPAHDVPHFKPSREFKEAVL